MSHLAVLSVLPLLAHAPSAAPAGEWTTEIALVAGVKLGGCAIAELLPDKDGLELAAVAQDGRFFVANRLEVGWRTRTVFRAGGEMIQVAVGDVDPRSPGNELIGVGMVEGPEVDGGPGTAWVVRRDGDEWIGERIVDTDGLAHAVCVRDGAAFVSGYDERLHRVAFVDGQWRDEVLGELPGAGKSLVAALGGVVVACTDGSLILFAKESGVWTHETLDRRDTGRARLGAHEDTLVVCDDDGTLSLVTREGRTELLRSPRKLRGAVLADLDAASPGLEAATCGYTGEVTVVRAREGSLLGAKPDALATHVPFVDADRLHHLAAGDLDGDGDMELVTGGYAGLLVVLEKR